MKEIRRKPGLLDLGVSDAPLKRRTLAADNQALPSMCCEHNMNALIDPMEGTAVKRQKR